MDEMSETESQGRESKIDNDGSTVPAVITDEYFDEITSKCSTTVKTLLMNQNAAAADDLQTVLTIAENLRTNWNNEIERVKQAQKQYDELLGRYEDTTKAWSADKEKIRMQRNEIETAWRERDAALLRDQLAQKQLHSMSEKLGVLEADAKKSSSNTRDEPGMSLTKQKESLIRDRDRLTAEVDDLNKRLEQQHKQNEALEKKRAEYEEKCRELYKMLDETSSEAFKEKRSSDQLRVVLNDVTNERNTLNDQLKHVTSQCETLQTNNIQLNLKIGAIKANLIRMTSQYNVCNGKLSKAVADLNEITSKYDQLQIDLTQQQNLLKQKDIDMGKLAKQSAQLMKNRDATQKRIQCLETEKTELVQVVTKLSNSIATLEKKHETSQKALDKMKKTTDEVFRERDAIQKDLKRTEKILDDQRDVIKLQDQHRQSLESELKTLSATIEQQRKSLNDVKRERDRNATNSQVNAGRIDATQSELAMKTKEIAEVTWELEEIRTKLTHTQQQYDTLMAERNALQKSLDAITDDRNETRDKLRVAVSEQSKLKQTIAEKNTELLRSTKQIDKIEKEKSSMKNDMKNATVAIQHIRTELNEKEHECTSLYKSLMDEEKKCARLVQKLEALQNEKDQTGAELVKRSDELRISNEKLQIMQTALDRGEMQYNNRLEDIRLLKIEVKNLRAQKNLLTRSLCNTVDMRQEVLQLNRDLTQERVKSKALEEEMTTPMNIHRWRRLSGKDPEKMDLIVKVQTLQKRILFQTAVAVEKGNALRQSNILYNSLKSAMQQFSSVGMMKEQLSYTRRALTAKTRTIKALSAEANVRDREVKLKDMNIETLRRDLFDKKQVLLREKRDKHKLKLQLDILKNQVGSAGIERPVSNPVGQVSVNKTAGAGYKMAGAYSFDC